MKRITYLIIVLAILALSGCVASPDVLVNKYTLVITWGESHQVDVSAEYTSDTGIEGNEVGQDISGELDVP